MGRFLQYFAFVVQAEAATCRLLAIPFGSKWLGVNHLLDACVNQALTSHVVWFPSFLASLQKVVRVLSYASYTHVIVANLKEKTIVRNVF